MDKLNKYKKGKLTPEELEVFTDKFMRAKHDNDRKNRWGKQLQEKHNVSRDNPKNQNIIPLNKKFYFIVMAAAAAIALLLFAGPLTTTDNTSSYDQLAAAYLSDNFYENQSITKSDQDIEQLNLEAILAYNQKNFTTAIQNFESILSQGAATDEQYFFLGLSYLYNKQYKSAASSLRQTLRLFPDSRFKQEVNWFLALSYLKNENTQEGKTILNTISPTEWNYAKAQQLLETIE